MSLAGDRRPLQEALVAMMVLGAHRAGGLTPERADVLLTILLEHPRFSGQDEDQLQEMLARACEAPRPLPLAELARQLQAEAALAFQLTALVAAAGASPTPTPTPTPTSTPDSDGGLREVAASLGLAWEEAQAILDAGVPPELEILHASPLPEEVYLDVLLAAAASDGRVAPEELDLIVEYAASRLELRLLPRSEIEDLMTASLAGFLDHGVTRWLETLTDALPAPEQRQTAYRLAAELIAADHIVHHAEERFLQDLQAALGLA